MLRAGKVGNSNKQDAVDAEAMMDYFFLQAIVEQLQPQLRGAVLNKVFQPAEGTVVFRLWNGRCEQRLLIAVDGGNPRLYLSNEGYRNPLRPPRFCQLLRARLKRLLQIQIDDEDRIVRLDFAGTQDEPYQLIAELFGRDANLILVDGQGLVVDSLLRSDDTSLRKLTAGQPYIAAQRRAAWPLTMAASQLARRQLAHGQGTASELSTQFFPMSPTVAAALVDQAGAQSLPETVAWFVEAWQARQLMPQRRGAVLTMFPSPADAPVAPVDLSAFAQQHYSESSACGLSGNADLAKAVTHGLRRLHQRLKNIDQQLQSCHQAESDLERANLLLAHLHLVRRGMAEVSVVNYYQPSAQELVLTLDPAKTPQQNVESYFKRYRKAQRGLEHCQRRQQQTHFEIEWLEHIDQQLEEIRSAADLDMIRQELIESGWYQPTSSLLRDTRRQSPASLVKRGQTPNGWEILWGHNNKTNDYLSKHLLKANDLWFHAHNIPGCHLILKSNGAAVAETDQLFAAAVAASHCRARNDSRVEVMVTEGRWVKRIKGAPPGLVQVEKYRVLLVAPADCN